MNEILTGAIVAIYFVIGMFFLRFWRTTSDRFFLLFSVSFLIEGVNRILMGTWSHEMEVSPVFYLLRFLSFSLIIVAILDKNRSRDK
ncbi:MAG: DUF5985 family protein [Pseudomonadota bacterium]